MSNDAERMNDHQGRHSSRLWLKPGRYWGGLTLTWTQTRSWQTSTLVWCDILLTGWYLAANGAVRGQCGADGWLLLSNPCLWEQKGSDMWHRLPNPRGFNWLSRSIVHQIKRGNISTCLLISSKGLHIQTNIHSTFTLLRHLLGWQELVMRTSWERVFCHIWLHSALAWWMTQQKNQPDSTRQRLCMSFAPYIHKSLIMAPVFGIYMYIFIHLSALVSKGSGRLCRYSSSFVCLG